MDYGVASSSSLSYSICNLEMAVTRMRGTSKNPPSILELRMLMLN